MTEKRFGVSGYTDKLYDRKKGNQYYFEDMADWHHICRLLNELNDENERLRSLFTELAELIEYDIENNIGVYPKTLLEYIISAIRKLGE